VSAHIFFNKARTYADLSEEAEHAWALFLYEFAAFKGLAAKFPDVAAFYIRYKERHWISEKEPGEIAFRRDRLGHHRATISVDRRREAWSRCHRPM